MRRQPPALFAMRARYRPLLFPPALSRRLQHLCVIDPGLVVEDFANPSLSAALERTEVLITGWGCPPLDASVLDRAPRLRAVLHAAGSVKAHVTDQCWRRGVVVSSAAVANALPVAEYTLATILLSGKRVFAYRELFARDRVFPEERETASVGNLGLRVGIVGASKVGRRLIELLRPFDIEVTLADPYVDQTSADALGVRLAGLDDLIASSDVVSLHAPLTGETRHLIDGRRLALMRDGATLINTARGAVVDTSALAAELMSGRLSAVLDVTDPEPLPGDSPLYELPNVVLTPHIAGSHGNELQRMGQVVVDELDRLVNDRELEHIVSRAELDRVA